MTRPRLCAACGAKPEGYLARRFCYDCKPGLSGRPGPCRRCGAVENYWASGLCAGCHRSAPRGPESCVDCWAWGRHRQIGLCDACRRWRKKSHAAATCRRCDRVVSVNEDGICRLCRRQLLLTPEEGAHQGRLGWHQLFFADLSRVQHRPERRVLPRPGPRRELDSPGVVPRRHKQLTLFTLPRIITPPFQLRLCKGCGQRPVRTAPTRYCHRCVPGGPLTPPPCRRCGSIGDYYSAGLCSRCHKYSPHRVGSCIDCFAWGATRAQGWRCESCRAWHRNYAVGQCVGCDRTLPVGRFGACRLCYIDAARRRRHDGPWDFVAPEGQQLFLADMRRKAGRRRPRHPQVDRPFGRYPVEHRQLVLFEIVPDLVAARPYGFVPPPDPEVLRFFEHHVDEHGRGHGWSPTVRQRTRQGLRILLGLQDTPGAPIRASHVLLLNTIGLAAEPVLLVLEAVGMLHDDRPSSFRAWLDTKLVGLPPAMINELEVAADVLLHGHRHPPRLRPRQRKTTQAIIRGSLPAIRIWAQHHESLREVTRADVLAYLPPSGTPRSVAVTNLRALFRVLKACKLVFANPTARIAGAHRPGRIPMPADPAVIQEQLSAQDPAVAALAALVAFHALTPAQIRSIRLTDVRDGRLYIDGRVVVLADAVHQRLRAYLDYRNRRWPNSANPYMFLHQQNAGRTTPVNADWITIRLRGAAQAIREDRILDELHATGGDVRRLHDLFGLSVSGATRYLATLSHPELDPPPDEPATS